MSGPYYFRSNDAGSGAFYFRTNDASAAIVQGVTDAESIPTLSASGDTVATVSAVTDAESVPSVAALGYKTVTFASPFNFGVGSFFAPFRFTGTPVDGDTCRYPDVDGLIIDSDGRLHADSNDIDVTCYYNNGSGEQAFELIVDDSTDAIVQSVADAESVPTVSAVGGTPGNASVSGVTDAESVPSVAASVSAAASVSGVTDAESVPTVAAIGSGAASVSGVTDAESVPSVAASGDAAASVSGVTDAESVPSLAAEIDAQVSGVSDDESVPTLDGAGGAAASVSGVTDAESVPAITADEIPETVYATQANMISRFGSVEITQLSDKENVGSINASVLAQALADADAEIDGYLEGRYELPLKVVPRILTTYACDIARYRLYDDRATEQVTNRYNNAVKFLTMIAQRKMALGLSLANEAQETTSGGPSAVSSPRVFTDRSLSDFKGDCS